MNLQESIRRILREESKIPQQVRRRISSFDNLSDRMKKESLRYIGKGISLDTVIDYAAIFITQEVIPWHDEQGNDYPQEEYSKWFESFRKFLMDEYGEETKEYLEENELEGSFDDDGYKYVFWKHSEPSGGNGFSEGYDTWGKLLQARGWWFPLDWKKIKSELDKMDEGKKLILRPNDKHNTMGYYFSIIKKK